jgi:6-pyruvoyl-tetrahydropterin synthase related domain
LSRANAALEKTDAAAVDSLTTGAPVRGGALLGAPLLAIGAAAFAAEVPFFFFGTPSGHDVEFHLYSWLEVLSSWKQGIIFPRWAAQANFGYGEPRFIFYPLASWTLGALLSAIFPWNLAASVYIWLVLVLAGLSMFLLVRRWFDRRDAVFAATLYAVNPYHLVIVYWRSAFAELLAACLLPLLLLLVLRAAEEGLRVIAPLALVLAAAWLTNAPAAIMIHYALALLLVLLAWQRRSVRPVLVGAGAVILGAGLAAFYLLPAVYEQKWVNIAEAVSAGSRPQDNFLFVHTSDADHDAFNRIVSWVATLEIVATLFAALAGWQWRQAHRTVWNILLGLAGAAGALMLAVTAPLWRWLPKIEFMQFPWRWLLWLSLICSIFLTASMRKWWVRAAVCLAGLLVIATAWHGIQSPWWDNVSDLREMRDNMADRIGYEGVEEYTPVGADLAGIDKDARSVTVEGPARASIHVLHWGSESREFTAEMSAPDRLALRLFRYPAWRVEVNGQAVEARVHTESGQMLVPVAAGINRVQIKFVRTWDRTAGGWISFATASGFVVWYFRRRGTTLTA